MPTPNTTTHTWELTCVTSSAASAMPARSAPMLIVFAMSSATHAPSRSGLGNFSLSAAMRPLPVTMPMRAHIVCTDAMRGHKKTAIQSSPVPSCAPATE